MQGPVGVANKHVETAIDEASGKLTMLYQVSAFQCPYATLGALCLAGPSHPSCNKNPLKWLLRRHLQQRSVGLLSPGLKLRRSPVPAQFMAVHF